VWRAKAAKSARRLAEFRIKTRVGLRGGQGRQDRQLCVPPPTVGGLGTLGGRRARFAGWKGEVCQVCQGVYPPLGTLDYPDPTLTTEAQRHREDHLRQGSNDSARRPRSRLGADPSAPRADTGQVFIRKGVKSRQGERLERDWRLLAEMGGRWRIWAGKPPQRHRDAEKTQNYSWYSRQETGQGEGAEGNHKRRIAAGPARRAAGAAGPQISQITPMERGGGEKRGSRD
jgi:hypothetical protein